MRPTQTSGKLLCKQAFWGQFAWLGTGKRNPNNKLRWPDPRNLSRGIQSPIRKDDKEISRQTMNTPALHESTPNPGDIGDIAGSEILRLARGSIEYGLFHSKPLPVDCDELPRVLAEPAATFTTVRFENQLRGCCGTLEAVRPLAEDVSHSAFRAAFRDVRFEPVGKHELEAIRLEVSVLSPLEFAHPVNTGHRRARHHRGRPPRDVSAESLGDVAGSAAIPRCAQSEMRPCGGLLVRTTRVPALPHDVLLRPGTVTLIAGHGAIKVTVP